MIEIKKTAEQMQAAIDKAIENPNIYSGMTYSEGVQAALNWVLGHTDDHPIED